MHEAEKLPGSHKKKRRLVAVPVSRSPARKWRTCRGRRSFGLCKLASSLSRSGAHEDEDSLPNASASASAWSGSDNRRDVGGMIPSLAWGELSRLKVRQGKDAETTSSTEASSPLTEQVKQNEELLVWFFLRWQQQSPATTNSTSADKDGRGTDSLDFFSGLANRRSGECLSKMLWCRALIVAARHAQVAMSKASCSHPAIVLCTAWSAQANTPQALRLLAYSLTAGSTFQD